MKFDTELMARLQAATANIQKRLAGGLQQDAAADTATDTSADTSADTGNAAARKMKDINPPPPRTGAAQPKASGPAPAKDSEPASAQDGQAAGRPSFTAGAGMPDVAALLAKLGIKLPDGALPGMPDLANMPQMPNMPDLPNMPNMPNMPGMRKRAPAPPLPEGARFLSASYGNHAGTRNYKLYIPASYSGQPMPLVVMLHGCTQDPDDFAAGTRMNQLAEESGCLVAWPEQPQHANSSRCWNWFHAAHQQREQGEPSIIAGIARQVMADYAVDASRVSIAGLSAGGAMAVVVSALYPELFEAAGIHSGLPFAAARDLPGALQAMKTGARTGAGHQPGPRLIIFHGDKDSTVHPANGAQILESGIADGDAGAAEVEKGKATGGRKYTRSTHRRADGTLIAEHWVLHGGGHAWAGGSACGSYTDGTGPDASREMLRFFNIEKSAKADCGI